MNNITPNLDFVKQSLNNIKKEIIGRNLNNDQIDDILDSTFERYSIRFQFGGEKDSKDPEWKEIGLVQSYINGEGEITIQYNEDFYKTFEDDNLWDEFLILMELVLGHELIHRLQFIYKPALIKIDVDPKNVKQYLSYQHEMEAFAWEAINELYLKGFYKEEIYKALYEKDWDGPILGQSDIIRRYLKTFKNSDSSILFDFFNEMEQYLWNH